MLSAVIAPVCRAICAECRSWRCGRTWPASLCSRRRSSHGPHLQGCLLLVLQQQLELCWGTKAQRQTVDVHTTPQRFAVCRSATSGWRGSTAPRCRRTRTWWSPCGTAAQSCCWVGCPSCHHACSSIAAHQQTGLCTSPLCICTDAPGTCSRTDEQPADQCRGLRCAA